MIGATALPYLEGYSPAVQARVRELLALGQLGPYLASRYGEAHTVRTDKALFQAAMELKDRFLKNAPPLHKALYDPKLQLLSQALGTLTAVSRVQGGRLKASREIRVAAVFREAPAPFLRMILVHELAHLKEREHNKAFYQLCTHMEPDYFQLEFDLRLYLTHREAGASAPANPSRTG
ncbi:MAG: M48 family metallopeptidase [Acidobacteria bacterium]|nr:M48 family metallopeptidase [Acidobacteriota bacterium]MBI3489552.1 M48 family metallopeptidase [Acidobacteriota bacterium]